VEDRGVLGHGQPPGGGVERLEVDVLGAAIGVARLFLKDDSRNPSLSFKDRPVALALARALELGLDTLACASTGNLAGAVAAAAARNGLRAVVFVPATTDEGKIAELEQEEVGRWIDASEGAVHSKR
jgi:threonine synthase